MTTGWSLYVIFLVVLNIAATTWLLWWTARKRKSDGNKDSETTGHVWDGDRHGVQQAAAEVVDRTCST